MFKQTCKEEIRDALDRLDKATAKFQYELDNIDDPIVFRFHPELHKVWEIADTLSHRIEEARTYVGDDYRLYEVEVSSKHLVWVKGGDEAEAAHIAKHYTESNFLGMLCDEHHNDADVTHVEHMETRRAQDWDPEMSPDAEV